MLEQERMSPRVAVDVLAGAADAWLAPRQPARARAPRRLALPLLLLLLLTARTSAQGLIYLSAQPASLDLALGTLVAVLFRRRLRLSLGGAIAAAVPLELAVLAARWLLPGYAGLAGLLLWSAFICFRLRPHTQGWPRGEGEGGAGAGVPAKPRPDPAPISVAR